MSRWLLALLLGLVLAGAPVLAGPAVSSPASDEQKGTYLGVLFSAVPEVLYAQVPALPRDQGVLVSYVLPDSPAARAGIQRHDILLTYSDEKIRDCEHFATLINNDKPEHSVKLHLLRGGQEKTAEATLTLGPKLKLAQNSRTAGRDNSEPPRAVAKPNGPATVRVAARPLDGGQMKVTIEYHDDGSGKLESVSCTGNRADIETEIQKLPSKVAPLARAAFQRVCDLQQKGAPPATSDRR